MSGSIFEQVVMAVGSLSSVELMTDIPDKDRKLFASALPKLVLTAESKRFWAQSLLMKPH